MGLRPSRCFRDYFRKPAWTKYSRSKPRKSYIKAMPHRDLNQFRMGNKKSDYDCRISLISDDFVVVRDNALESARKTANKFLETNIPQGNYYFWVRVYPHHVIRENKMIAAAGADRLQKGMRKAFGKPTDRAARIRRGQEVLTVFTYKSNVGHVKKALERAVRRLSGTYSLSVSVGEVGLIG